MIHLTENIRNNANIREINQQIVLSYLRKNKISSRIDICNETYLSKSTITRVIKNLIEEGLVHEIGSFDAEFGRKPMQIELMPFSRYCIGINLSKNHIYGVLINLNMDIVKQINYSLNNIKSCDEFLNFVAEIINELISSTELDKRKIMGIGIGVPGFVDYNNGFIWKLDIINPINNIPIKQFIEKNIGYITMVDNNANTMALGEYWYGSGYSYNLKVQNLIYVICNGGVDAGIIYEGNLLRCQKNLTVEFGNFIITLDKTGCKRLEEYCSVDRIEKVMGMPYEEICNLALQNDSECLNLLNEAGIALTMGLVNIILTLNPELIILSGKLLDAYPPLFNLVVERVNNCLKIDFVKPEFTLKKMENSLFGIGAATLIFKQLFIN